MNEWTQSWNEGEKRWEGKCSCSKERAHCSVPSQMKLLNIFHSLLLAKKRSDGALSYAATFITCCVRQSRSHKHWRNFFLDPQSFTSKSCLPSPVFYSCVPFFERKGTVPSKFNIFRSPCGLTGMAVQLCLHDRAQTKINSGDWARPATQAVWAMPLRFQLTHLRVREPSFFLREPHRNVRYAFCQ